jgi:hypothetical protein
VERQQAWQVSFATLNQIKTDLGIPLESENAAVGIK